MCAASQVEGVALESVLKKFDDLARPEAGQGPALEVIQAPKVRLCLPGRKHGGVPTSVR